MSGPWERYREADVTPQGPWSRYQQAEEAAPEGGTGALPFLNQGIARVLGGPVDLMNAGLGAVGLPTSDQPFGGSASIQQGMRYLSPTMAPAPGAEPQTPGEYIGHGVGEAAGALLPMGLAARGVVSAATPAAQMAMRYGGAALRGMTPGGTAARVAAQLTAAPGSMAALDLASGAGAGAGRYIGEQNTPENPNIGGTIGELVGGLGVGGTVAGLGAAGRLAAQGPVGRAVIGTGRQVAGAFLPGTQAGSSARATGRLQGLVADPQVAAAAAEGPSIGNLTPAQRTGDPSLLALERAVADVDPTIRRQLEGRARASQDTLEGELRNLGGDPNAARTYLEGRRARLNNDLRARLEAAQADAARRVAALDPGARPAEQSRVVREAFDAAYNDARRQENQLWRAIPEDVQIPVAPLRDAWRQLVAETPTTQRQDLPDYARGFLDPESNTRLPDTVPPGELQGLRSGLLDIERQAAAAGQRNRARLARNLAEDVLRTMDAQPDLGEAYTAARAFSRELNETFRQGQVAPLARSGRDGAPRVSPELTLDTTIGGGGERGALAARELTTALGPRAGAAQPAIQDYLRNQVFGQFVTPEGQIREASVARWMRQNAGLLDQYPEVRSQLAGALRSQAQAARAGARADTVGRNLNNPRVSAAARYLSGDLGEEVARVFSAPDPAAVADQVRRQVARDPSGAALAGLKGAFSDFLITQARQNTPDGAVLNGSRINAVLEDPRQRAALSRVYSPDEVRRIERVASELTNLERSRGRLPSVGAPMDDAPNMILNTVARIAGARAGAAAGGGGMAGSLQSAQIMSGRVRDFMYRLTNDRAARLLSEAVTDPELFGALMAPGRSMAAQRDAARRLDAWLAGPGLRAFEGEEEERPQPQAARGSRGQLAESLLRGQSR
jgi:hypothetical protein